LALRVQKLSTTPRKAIRDESSSCNKNSNNGRPKPRENDSEWKLRPHGNSGSSWHGTGVNKSEARNSGLGSFRRFPIARAIGCGAQNWIVTRRALLSLSAHPAAERGRLHMGIQGTNKAARDAMWSHCLSLCGSMQKPNPAVASTTTSMRTKARTTATDVKRADAAIATFKSGLPGHISMAMSTDCCTGYEYLWHQPFRRESYPCDPRGVDSGRESLLLRLGKGWATRPWGRRG
jgi:hypothetical protein